MCNHNAKSRNGRRGGIKKYPLTNKINSGIITLSKIRRVKRMSTLLAVIIVIALVFGILCFEGWIFMLLANWVLSLFSVAFAFTFWQAFGVVLLLSFIGGFFKSSSSSK